MATMLGTSVPGGSSGPASSNKTFHSRCSLSLDATTEPAVPPEKGKRVSKRSLPLVNISVVEGKSAELPCDITPPGEDTLHMVFWFRDEAGVPLYTMDAREKPVAKAQHSSDSTVFGRRAYFRTEFQNPAILVIKDVKRHDAATYRCRVDFRKGQTRSFRYSLIVIGVDRGKESRDGKPEPVVRWLVNGRVKDEEYEKNAGDVIENRREMRLSARSKAATANPPIVSLNLGSTLSPEDIKEGDDVYFECHIRANPAWSKLTWIHDRLTSLDWRSKSKGKPVALTESLTYAKRGKASGLWNPRRAARLHRLRFALIEFPERRILNLYNQILAHNTSARIIWSNQSLVLQSVTRSSAGKYVCAATNDLNETRSEPLHFRVNSLNVDAVTTLAAIKRAEGKKARAKVAPVCKEDRIVVVGASRGESLNIACKVEADPPAHNFRWKFNNSGETLEVAQGRFSMETSSGVSVFRYTPTTELDYGTLSCWADNSVGRQARPCLFQLIAAGKPFPVRNCTLANQTYTSVEVKCVAGYDGGLPQKFILEVYHGDVDFLSSSQPLYNVSNADEPSFSLAGLEASVEAGVHVAVYAVNAKGRSQPVILSEVTYRDAEKRTGQDAGIVLSPLIGVVVGALVTLVLVILVVVVRVRRERVSKPRHEKPAELSELPPQQYPLQNPQQTVETDPDVIPNKFEGSLAEVSPPSYPGGYPPGHWVTPGPTPSIEELCHKFTGRPTELRLPSRSTLASLQSMPMTGGAVMGGGGQGGVVPLGGGQGVVVAGECLDGEAIKRRLMANRLPESCILRTENGELPVGARKNEGRKRTNERNTVEIL
ncbi:Titin [Apis cerana cerana]|uniref:Titin n=1 Tax=Apis cerana cerana TaxID=94128 RepID=A0A2A3E6A3_APICC|nr:Titin [Apis cerana cerana]